MMYDDWGTSTDADIEDEESTWANVVAICPACSHATWPIGVVKGHVDFPIDVKDLPKSLFNEMAESGAFDETTFCSSCCAGIIVDGVSGAVTLEPVSSANMWIHLGRVPLGATLPGIWPTQWLTPPAANTSGGLDVQLVLEVLYLTRDPRLSELLERCEETGHIKYTRVGGQAWEAGILNWETDANGMIVFDGGDTFEESLAAVCPSPPSIEMVVAAVERVKKGVDR